MKILSLTIIFSLTSLCLNAQDNIVAEVNGKKITKEVFDQSFKQNQLFVTNKKVTKEKVLNDLINRALGIEKAKKSGLGNDSTVKEKMNDVLYHAQISKDLEPEFLKIKITDDSVKSYYKKNPEYRTAHILFRVRANPDKAETEEALKQALKVYQAAQKKPGKFSELANKYSQSSTAVNGGDLGFQPAVIMAPEYFEAINGKSKGYISPPVRTQFGYHIIKVLAVKKFKDINVPRYKKIVYDMERDNVIENYFNRLRSSAEIKINKQALK
ncbi:MAG: peptidylprolyl isomerase [Bdellovibrionales bacterium]|jgi:parvulin-like peptidyl-prolyl isomerase|nr:peptidylprolyl isomerase [Bdellovibrionales bacterium]